jgi:hypothetical protein
VYRGETVHPHSQRDIIDSDRGVRTPDRENMLFLNFGEESRATGFRAGNEEKTIKSFEVAKSFLEELQRTSVRERDVKKNKDSPIRVDVRKAPNQYGLREAHIEELMENIKPGSGCEL